ncbi:recombinase family protein [Streptomyces griseofuscus]|uniref:hypothetical protein n=1 Tax=Streptomyces griseofuscus TaxID=146922 RepID=UPI0033CBB26F
MSPPVSTRDKIFSAKISIRIRVRPQFEEALKTAREIKAHAPHCRVIWDCKTIGVNPDQGRCIDDQPAPGRPLTVRASSSTAPPGTP